MATLDWIDTSNGQADVLYYESHINLPYYTLTDEALALLTEIARHHRFKLSNMNGNDGHPDNETQRILTTHTQDHGEMVSRMQALIMELKDNNFKILRYKIEAATIDSRINDTWKIL